jgi:hypothetical protein
VANVATFRQPSPEGARAISLGVAIALHLALAAGLIFAIQIPRLVEPPVVQVSLVPPIPTEIAPRARPAPPQHVVERPLAPRPGRIVGPAPIPPLPIPAAPPSAATREKLLQAPFAHHEPLSDSLRTTAGCPDADALNLTPAERAACAKRARALGAGAPTYAVGPSDAKKRARLDAEAAKNEARKKELEAPGTHPMQACVGPGSNFGFSCTPSSAGDAHIKF